MSRPVGIFSHWLGAATASEAAANARRLGLDCIKVHRGEPTDLFGELGTPARCREVRRTYEDAAVTVVGFAAYRDLVMQDPCERERELRQFERWIRLAPELGTTLVATESGHWNTGFTRERYNPEENLPPAAWDALVASTTRLAAVAAEHGVTLGFEIVVDSALDSPDRALALFEAVGRPNLGVVLDPANLLTADNFGRRDAIIADAVATLAGRIVMVHGKDFGPAGRTAVPLGQIDFTALHRALLAAGYDGPIVLEKTDPSDLPAAIEALRRACA